MEEKKVIYYKRNVPYLIGVRFNFADSQGLILTDTQPWVAIAEDRLRDFKVANKRSLMEGLIIEVAEPSTDWQTPNALTEADIDELLKSYLKLKSIVATVDSVSILVKMIERAKEQNKSGKTISLIQARLDEVSPNEVITPLDMRGVS